ncbi:Adenylosuccinate synthetase, partial [mine drainage metagenome]
CSTLGLRSKESLPRNAQAYIDRIESLAGVPVSLISTGAEREETIVLEHPFAPPLPIGTGA